MNVMVVDDERMALDSIKRTVETAIKDANVIGFMKPSEALEYSLSLDKNKSNSLDLAFLDIEMGGMNGLQLAKSLKEIFSKVNIVFTTGYSQYAADAFAIHASGYLLKPITTEAVKEALDYLHHPIVKQQVSKIRIQTFGNFEVFADDKPLRFSRTKTKELLAYLVMRNGASCSNNEIVAVLWENRPDSSALQNQFRHLVFDLKNVLKSVGAEDILVRRRGALAIITKSVSCDLYDFFAGDTIAVNKFMGEFMAQYSWAEFNNAYLSSVL